MANSKSSKKRKAAQKRQQAQHRQAHNVQKARERDQHREHLPKTGTSEDDAYLYRRGLEDTVDFGLTRAKPGALTWIIAGVVVILIIFVVGFVLIY